MAEWYWLHRSMRDCAYIRYEIDAHTTLSYLFWRCAHRPNGSLIMMLCGVSTNNINHSYGKGRWVGGILRMNWSSVSKDRLVWWLYESLKWSSLSVRGLRGERWSVFEGTASLSSKQAKNTSELFKLLFLKPMFVTEDSKNSIGSQNLHWF